MPEEGSPTQHAAKVQRKKKKKQKEPKEPQQPQLPLNFAKRLAHTDKVIRDRGFRLLRAWLQRHPDLERLDYLKLWKGLYYAMWMSDKRPVQQELAVNMALMVNDVAKAKQALWMDCFWETLEEGWERLDTHRMNKYLFLVRVAVAEYFKVLREDKWNLDRVKEVGQIFLRSVAAAGVSGPNIHSVGILLHLARVLWDELKPQLGESPKAPIETQMALLEPFCMLAEKTYSVALVKSINSYVLQGAPEHLKDPLLMRVMDGLERTKPALNRKALLETAVALGAEMDSDGETPRPKPKRKAFGSFQPKEKEKKKKKKAAKPGAGTAEGNGAKDSGGGMSPLLLPQATLAHTDKCPLEAKTGRKSTVLDPSKRKRKRKALAVKARPVVEEAPKRPLKKKRRKVAKAT